MTTDIAAASAPRAAPSVLWAMPALPLAGAGIAALFLVVGWAIGASPFWIVPQLTLSEAVATRDAGEVVRLIVYEHVNPNQAWPVRAALMPGGPDAMTPLEAAVVTRRLDMVRLLVHRGAQRPAGATRDRLICQAAATGSPDIVEFLLADGAGDPRSRCTPSISSLD